MADNTFLFELEYTIAQAVSLILCCVAAYYIFKYAQKRVRQSEQKSATTNGSNI